MGKLKRYFLRGAIIIFLFGCTENKVPESVKKQVDNMINGGHEILKPRSQGTAKMMLYVEKAIQLDPENSDAWRELSVPYLKRGMPLDWKRLFDKAVELDADNWQGWRGYLYLYFYRNYNKAIEDFDATDSITPNFDDHPQGQSVNYMRGIAYLGLEKFDKSLEYFDTYLEDQLKQSGETYTEITAFLYKGIVLFEMKKYKEAIVWLHKVLQYSNQHYADAHYYISKSYEKLNYLDKAENHIEKALSDFKEGYSHKRDYVEVLYQIYIQDLERFRVYLQKRKG